MLFIPQHSPQERRASQVVCVVDGVRLDTFVSVSHRTCLSRKRALAEGVDGGKTFVKRKKTKEERTEIVVVFKNTMGDEVGRQGCQNRKSIYAGSSIVSRSSPASPLRSNSSITLRSPDLLINVGGMRSLDLCLFEHVLVIPNVSL